MPPRMVAVVSSSNGRNRSLFDSAFHYGSSRPVSRAIAIDLWISLQRCIRRRHAAQMAMPQSASTVQARTIGNRSA